MADGFLVLLACPKNIGPLILTTQISFLVYSIVSRVFQYKPDKKKKKAIVALSNPMRKTGGLRKGRKLRRRGEGALAGVYSPLFGSLHYR